METKDVVVNGKQIKLKEISYLDFLKLIKLKDSPEEYAIKLFEFSTVSKEIYENFSVNEGNQLVDEINKFNGFTNFQQNSK